MNTPIIYQLATITDKINAPNTDAEKRIEEWEESKIQNKLVERISIEVALNKVKLSEVITEVKSITQIIFQFLIKLCTSDTFNVEVSEKIKGLEVEIKLSTQVAITEPTTFLKHINRVQEL